jgi:hypothetical protein
MGYSNDVQKINIAFIRRDFEVLKNTFVLHKLAAMEHFNKRQIKIYISTRLIQKFE